MSTHPALPFQLARAASGVWFAKWQEANLRVSLAGDAVGPHPALLLTLHELVARWNEVSRAIVAFLRGLPPDHRVPLETRRPDEAFRAAICGFDSEPYFGELRIQHVGEPERADVTFDTGQPDGYTMYRIHLVGGVPVAVSAFAT